MQRGAVRLVLKESDPRKAVSTLAYREQWDIAENVKKTDDTPHSVLYRPENSDVRIRYTEDHILKLAYLTITGSRAEEIAEVARQRLKVFTMDELLDEANRTQSRDDWIWALYQLAAAAPADADQRIVRVFERALQQDDPDVRQAAMVAMGYAEWPELRPILERVQAKDPDPRIRDFARITLEGLEKVWRERSA